MLKHSVCVAAIVAAAIPLSAGGGAENVKLSTLVPAGTSWHKALLDMGNAWNRDTAGHVTLTVFAGGQQGDEATAIKKMRSDVLQASFLSNVGLAELDEAFAVFSTPFFIETPEEEAAVERKLTPVLEKRLEAKGFHLLCWGSAIGLGIDKPELVIDLPVVRALAERAIALDDGWNKGALHEMFISLDSQPEALGGSVEHARAHFTRAVELQQGSSPGPYVSLAIGVAEPAQDRAEFESLLKQALAIDPEKDPSTRLVTLVQQRRAQALLDHIDSLFTK